VTARFTQRPTKSLRISHPIPSPSEGVFVTAASDARRSG
jgi:hypothetical protein